MWPFNEKNGAKASRAKLETQPFTDALIKAILSESGGTTPGDPAALWALEAAAALYARAFSAAKITGERAAGITPSMMALIGRNLIRRGDSLHVIELRRGRVDFIPAGSWDVRGGWDETAWFYRADLFGPSGNITRFVPASGVVHFRYAVDPATPWHGIGPLGWARDSATLGANLEKRLGEETGGVVAHVLPVPSDGGGDDEDDDPLASLKADIRGAKGRTILTETTAAGWGEGRGAAPQSDWKPQRIGAHPPDVLKALRSDAGLSVLSACGVPVSLATDADGTSQRESWRRFVMGAVEPLLEIVRGELEMKLESSVAFDLTGLWAHDLAGRAQAFQKLVAGGVSVDSALSLSGLMVED